MLDKKSPESTMTVKEHIFDLLTVHLYGVDERVGQGEVGVFWIGFRLDGLRMPDAHSGWASAPACGSCEQVDRDLFEKTWRDSYNAI